MGNYSLKNIMLGIGIGLVFSSMININMGNSELTAEEIKKEALKHNLIVLTKEEILSNQTPEAVEPSQTTPVPAATPSVNEGKITVNVESGMSSESIANLLKESGIINDTKAFLKTCRG